MNGLAKKLVICSATAIAVVACGAKLKNADQVGGAFAATKDLGTKVDSLCTILSQRTTEPTLNGVGLSSDACQQAGLQAQNLNLNADLNFIALRQDGKKLSTNTGGIAGGDQTDEVQTRTEIWLNRSLLGIVKIVLPILKAKADGTSTSISQPDPNQNYSAKMVGSPVFDATNFTFHADFDLTSTKAQNGSADIQNRFSADAAMFNEQFGAATVMTTQDMPFSQSFIKRAKILVFVVPHAGDIYVDIITDITLNSTGAFAIEEKTVLTALSNALKSIPKLLNDAEANANVASSNP